jgi:hypothetical protein
MAALVTASAPKLTIRLPTLAWLPLTVLSNKFNESRTSRHH